MEIIKYSVHVPNVLIKESTAEYPINTIDSPAQIVEFINTVFALDKKAEEYLYMIAFNAKNKPLGVFEVSHGSVDFSVAQPRELLLRALLVGATTFVLIHNHPSGNPTPSASDIDVTKRIVSAANILGVSCLDHIIVGDSNYYSLRIHKSDLF